MIQMTHDRGGYGMTPDAISQLSAKVAMASRFLGLVGSLPPSENRYGSHIKTCKIQTSGQYLT